MKIPIILSISISLALLVSGSVFGATIKVPDDYATIQEAIDAAVDGDIVLVADGVYTGEGNKNVDFRGKAITVQSEHGPEHSIINCEKLGRGFLFHSGESEDSVVSGFTITHGKGYPKGSGIRCENGSSPTIKNCNIQDNIGVGLYCVSNSSPIIQNCSISANTGSGILCNSSSPTIMNCDIIGNSSHLGGGGIDCENASSPTIKNCIIADNDGYRAGGIACSGGSSPTISDCTIRNNSSRGYEGGGIKFVDSSPIITRCIINGNQAGPVETGGGILARNSSAIISDCTISNNTAGHGGGIQVNGGSPTISNCVISGNEAGGKGGGINVNNGSPTITNCFISGNNANSSLRGGGGIYIRNASAIITSCTIANNTANEGGGIYCFKQLSQSVPTVTNCIFWEDTPNEIHNGCSTSFTITYSDIQGGYTGEGNIEADPLFVDPDNGDFHLSENSPCKDAGTDAGVYHDIDGDSRPQGAGFDIGADEFVINEILAYTPVTPCRIADTRKAGGAILPDAVRSYNVWGAVASQGGNSAGCPSPKGEPRAVHVNITAVPKVANGWITAYPYGSTVPTASLVNYRSDAQNVANSGTIKTCFNCTKDISIKSGGGKTHVIIDVLGYYYAVP